VSILLYANASVSEAENLAFPVLVWLNGIVDVFDDKTASCRSTPRLGYEKRLNINSKFTRTGNRQGWASNQL
jgi:hypothetical protein